MVLPRLSWLIFHLQETCPHRERQGYLILTQRIYQVGKLRPREGKWSCRRSTNTSVAKRNPTLRCTGWQGAEALACSQAGRGDNVVMGAAEIHSAVLQAGVTCWHVLPGARAGPGGALLISLRRDLVEGDQARLCWPPQAHTVLHDHRGKRVKRTGVRPARSSLQVPLACVLLGLWQTARSSQRGCP